MPVSNLFAQVALLSENEDFYKSNEFKSMSRVVLSENKYTRTAVHAVSGVCTRGAGNRTHRSKWSRGGGAVGGVRVHDAGDKRRGQTQSRGGGGSRRGMRSASSSSRRAR